MKRITLFFCGLLCLLIGVLGSCSPASDDDFDNQEASRVVAVPKGEVKDDARREEIRKEVDSYFQLGATKMTQYFSTTLTPQSGKNFKYELLYSQLYENKAEGYYAIRAQLIWEGRDLAKLIDYGTCKVGGYLYYYPETRKVYFIYDNRNNHSVKISSSKKWEELSKGVTITL